jgi:hypothetical protein
VNPRRAIALFLAALAGCRRGGSPTRFTGAPVVLISIDTLRADLFLLDRAFNNP